MNYHETIQDRTRGRWRDILIGLGLNASFLTGKNGPCPLCGGKDRWRFEDHAGSGSWVCNHCTNGRRQSGSDLVMMMRGINFLDAKKLIEEHIGAAQVHIRPATMSEEKRREDLRALWLAGRPLNGSDIASRYLEARGLKLSQWPSALRWCDRLPHKSDAGVRTVWPAMLAKFSASDCKSSTLHRTWLAEPGLKADVVPPRKFFPGAVPAGAVRLGEPAETMGIAEGIETALSATQLFGIPVWAATCAAQLAKWTPPSEAKCVIVCADKDPNFAGQSAAFALAHRLAITGLHVEVRIPEGEDQKLDFNDLVRA